MRPMRLFVVVWAVLAVVLGAAACDDEDEGVGPEDDPVLEDLPEEVTDDVNEDDVFADPDAFAGERITVQGEVSAVISSTAFRLTGVDDDAGGEPLLVIAAEGAADLQEGDVVRVEGTVEVVAEESFEDDFDLELGEGFGQFVGELAVAATGVEIIEQADR